VKSSLFHNYDRFIKCWQHYRNLYKSIQPKNRCFIFGNVFASTSSVKKSILIAIYTLFSIGVYAKNVADTAARSSPGTLGSRFYFPNSIGFSLPFRNTRTKLRGGPALNIAAEYRINNTNPFYFRVDYDVLNNNYTSYVRTLPTNIIQGKLSSDFILAGGGYRKKLDRWAIYLALQPGLGMRSFDRAVVNTNGVIISRATNDCFAGKAAAGLEYYIKSHFDVFFEPSYYKFFSHQGFNSSHSQFLGFNIGISTARF
jgi:hypothetical protein